MHRTTRTDFNYDKGKLEKIMVHRAAGQLPSYETNGAGLNSISVQC